MSKSLKIDNLVLTASTMETVRTAGEEAFAALPGTYPISVPPTQRGDGMWMYDLGEGVHFGLLAEGPAPAPSQVMVYWTVTIEGVAIIATPRAYWNTSSIRGWDHIARLLGLEPRELGRLPEPLLPLLPPAAECGEYAYPCDCGGGCGGQTARIHALRTEALAWRKRQAEKLLASCEE